MLSLYVLTITTASMTPGIHPQHVAKHKIKNIIKEGFGTNKTTNGGHNSATQQAIGYIS